MLRYRLTVANDNGSFEHCHFNTITEAYNYFVEKHATIKEREYYVDCANIHLEDVTNEEIMCAIFRNVFCGHAIITENWRYIR